MSGLISVETALAHLFALCPPLPVEQVDLADAAGRVLARPVTARRDQPGFDASAMDGYAICGDHPVGTRLTVIGTAAAGAGYQGRVAADQAVRILTGAPLPDGADRIVIQENVTRDSDMITLTDAPAKDANIRAKGGDFRDGDVFDAPRRLTPRDLALLAAMNLSTLPVHRRPVIALIATGDELVMPGETPGPDQIVASNSFGLKALCEAAGAQVRLLPIARDTETSLKTVFGLARGADVILTTGGASVGDHDLVAPVAEALGWQRQFHKVAMRPGKALMSGRMGDGVLIGLPGNPVSAMVCGEIFIRPVLDALQGLPARPRALIPAVLASDLPANGPRAHYMRGRFTDDGRVTPADSQDSALLSRLSGADLLIHRPPHDAPRAAGQSVDILPL